MRILVTGANGQLGRDVIKALERRGDDPVGADIAPGEGKVKLDVTDAEAVSDVMRAFAPEAVIHCAAWTEVDAAEDNRGMCRLINAKGTENVARCCAELGCKMLYISTDYVFNGRGGCFFEPDSKDIAPLNFYGLTKYEGELAVEKHLNNFFIVRISWVFGLGGKNFVKTMLSLADTQKSVMVVNDQFGSPTYTVDLARLLADMVHSERYGRYHATNEGVCSWYEFACEIFKQAGKTVKVLPVCSADYPSRAKRPSNSRMSKEKLSQNGFGRLPDWRDALHRYLIETGCIDG